MKNNTKNQAIFTESIASSTQNLHIQLAFKEAYHVRKLFLPTKFNCFWSEVWSTLRTWIVKNIEIQNRNNFPNLFMRKIAVNQCKLYISHSKSTILIINVLTLRQKGHLWKKNSYLSISLGSSLIITKPQSFSSSFDIGTWNSAKLLNLFWQNETGLWRAVRVFETLPPPLLFIYFFLHNRMNTSTYGNFPFCGT